ncbi:hypothetical protein lerEdw1_013221 [Lerista edwardsae]|nr:hypothetical protein lerEdw1_013221 [Lerista edwardsae]
MFSRSRMFSWHQSFTIGAPWRKDIFFLLGSKMPSSDSKVVLTNVKMISSETNQSERLTQGPPVTTDSLEEPGTSEPSAVLEHQANLDIVTDSPVNAEYLATLPGLNTFASKCRLPLLAKFESEDSGVELPSGANSPLTPKGSEKSFVLHSRDSSCDSGMLSASSSPAADHPIMRMCKDAVDACLCLSDGKMAEEPSAEQAATIQTSAGLEGVAFCPGGKDPQMSSLSSNQEEDLEGKPSDGTNTFPPSTIPEGEGGPRDDPSEEALQEMPQQGHPLRKYSTSDSLDEYMDECCRLSEVNQGNAKALGSGLGYLEHICQLIEKIGQLQEHNLRLQKQVCSLQKEQKTIQLKEEYFLQHCSCGAASILFSSYQEAKTFFAGKSRPHSLLVQNGNTSDLSIIPEMGGSHGKLSNGRRGEALGDPENNQLIMRLKITNGRNSGENECREGCTVTDGQTYLPKESALKRGSGISRSTSVESHAWGRMRDLVRKTRGRSQSRLGLTSAALKRSCPQLYRPDIVSLDLKKVERNSMIVLGKSSRNESSWPF